MRDGPLGIQKKTPATYLAEGFRLGDDEVDGFAFDRVAADDLRTAGFLATVRRAFRAGAFFPALKASAGISTSAAAPAPTRPIAAPVLATVCSAVPGRCRQISTMTAQIATIAERV